MTAILPPIFQKAAAPTSNIYKQSMGKGEIMNLRDQLDSNDSDARSRAAKRAVALMRAGENVGSLFSSMLRVVRTEDIALKRLVYYYLITYSSQEPEQSIMVVNTFIKDSEDYNPIVRALAVRSMCRIKISSVAEYMIIPLKKCLADKDAYVRKTAALAVAKIYEIIPETVETSELLKLLKECLKDENPMVVSNAVTSLLEINEKREIPYFTLNEETSSPVISALTQCSEWVQTLLLDALAKYMPSSSEEAGFLIDRLIPFLKKSNAAVVISAFKCIFAYMDKDVRPKQEIFEKIIPPFISLVGFAEPEVQFVVLRTLSLFVIKYPRALAKETRVFFCKYNDPSYVKLEKLDIIVTVCSAANVQIVVDELEEYCNSVDVAFVKKSIASLGQICLKVPVAARRCVDVLVKLVESKAEYAVEEAVCVLCDILRCFAGEFESVIGKVCANIELMKDPRSRAAAIWILGEYSHLIENVDVLLDPYLDSFHDEVPEVQIQILTSIVKVFVRNPEQNKDQIQFALSEATKESVLPDVRNRAFFFWRLLSSNQELAKQTLIFQKQPVNAISEAWDDSVITELIQNMGTVSGVMHIVTSDFLVKGRYVPEEEDDDAFADEKDWKRVMIVNDDRVVDIFHDWQPHMLHLKVVNKKDEPLSQFALAINRNCVGMGIKEHPTFPDHLDFGESFEVQIPLTFSESLFATPESPTIQFALRTSAGPKMFAMSVDLASVVLPVGDIGPAQFDMMWLQGAEMRIEIGDSTVPTQELFNSRSIKLVGTDQNAVNVVFSLPPSFVYCAKVTQKERKVEVVVHGDQRLFNAINDGANSLFCT